MDIASQLSGAVTAIVRRVDALAHQRCLVVAVSGIDASGKTTTARLLAQSLEAHALQTAVVHLDDWHTAPEVRFSALDPGGHFYRQAYRFTELFRLLVAPLKADRRLSLAVTLRQLPDNREFAHTYHFEDIDVLILEGILLLKAKLRSQYDYTIWVDCPFEMALRRAIHRNQEGLSAEEIVTDYRRIYFPAEELHIRRDAPQSHADLVISTATPQLHHRLQETKE